jgi:hypothetical protein
MCHCLCHHIGHHQRRQKYSKMTSPLSTDDLVKYKLHVNDFRALGRQELFENFNAALVVNKHLGRFHLQLTSNSNIAHYAAQSYSLLTRKTQPNTYQFRRESEDTPSLRAPAYGSTGETKYVT